MYLRYLVANAAYVVCFGATIVPINDQRFFNSKQEAKAALKTCGLIVKRGGRIVAA